MNKPPITNAHLITGVVFLAGGSSYSLLAAARNALSLLLGDPKSGQSELDKSLRDGYNKAWGDLLRLDDGDGTGFGSLKDRLGDLLLAIGVYPWGSAPADLDAMVSNIFNLNNGLDNFIVPNISLDIMNASTLEMPTSPFVANAVLAGGTASDFGMTDQELEDFINSGTHPPSSDAGDLSKFPWVAAGNTRGFTTPIGVLHWRDVYDTFRRNITVFTYTDTEDFYRRGLVSTSALNGIEPPIGGLALLEAIDNKGLISVPVNLKSKYK